MRAPTPATLRITGSRQSKEETPVMRSRAFQLAVVEAKSAPDVVTGMCLLLYFMLLSLLKLIVVMFMIRDVPSQ